MRILATVALLVLLVGACGQPAATPAPTPAPTRAAAPASPALGTAVAQDVQRATTAIAERVAGKLPTPVGQPVAAKAAYAVALKEAQAWKGDAQLVRVEGGDLGGTATGNFGTWAFTFVSPSSPQQKVAVKGVASIEIRVTEGRASRGRESLYETPIDSIPDSAWKIDSDAAYQAGANAGGTERIQRNPRVRGYVGLSARASLERLRSPTSKPPAGKGAILWRVSFSGPGQEKDFIVWVDAESGEVVGTFEGN